MAYFLLEHGFGNDPAQHFTTEYKSYKEAKKAARLLFDIYQHALETSTSPRVFTCIIKTRGLLNNVETDRTTEVKKLIENDEEKEKDNNVTGSNKDKTRRRKWKAGQKIGIWFGFQIKRR